MIWKRLFRRDRAEEEASYDAVRHPSLPEVTDATIYQSIDRTAPVLIVFAANGSMPCDMFEPVLHELAKQYAERIEVFRLDVEENPVSTADFDILSLPTLIVFHEGEVRQRVIGAKSKDALMEELAEHLAG